MMATFNGWLEIGIDDPYRAPHHSGFSVFHACKFNEPMRLMHEGSPDCVISGTQKQLEFLCTRCGGKYTSGFRGITLADSRV